MILQRTPEQMIWGYHEPLLEAAALLDDSLTFTSFGFFTKVIKLEIQFFLSKRFALWGFILSMRKILTTSGRTRIFSSKKYI